MHLNYYFLKQLSSRLTEHLVGGRLHSCFTQNKNELVMEFIKSDQHFFIKAILNGEVSHLSFPNEFARARKNSVALFPEIEGTSVCQIHQYQNERAFSLSFDNDYTLLFKLHGRQSNLILFKNDVFISMFKKNIKNDAGIKLSALDRNIDQSQKTLSSGTFDVRSTFPTFDRSIHTELAKRKTNMKESEAIHSILSELESGIYYVIQGSHSIPRLTMIRPDESFHYEEFSDPIKASNCFSRNYLSIFHFQNEQKKALSALDKELKKSASYVTKTRAKLDELKASRKMDEIANILMANLHQPISKHEKSIALTDFYQNVEISIKINPHLTLQKNAENYYRKAKNQKIEFSKLQQNIESKEAHILTTQEQIRQIENSSNVKELKPFTAKVKKTKKSEPESVPYYHQTIDGFDILIGKNAKNNDILTLKIATKNDLWLHAKDVPGSHVIIKSKGNDQYPKDTIEKVAQLAAWHSKRKNDTLCPVIFTLKKNVTKPKGSAPGLVRLMREEIIMVEPKRTVQP